MKTTSKQFDASHKTQPDFIVPIADATELPYRPTAIPTPIYTPSPIGTPVSSDAHTVDDSNSTSPIPSPTGTPVSSCAHTIDDSNSSFPVAPSPTMSRETCIEFQKIHNRDQQSHQPTPPKSNCCSSCGKFRKSKVNKTKDSEQEQLLDTDQKINPQSFYY